MVTPEPIPLFGLGVQEKSRSANAQRRVNLYYEMQTDPDRTRVVAYGTPGLELFMSFGATPSRGHHCPPSSNYAYFVNGFTLYEVNNAGVTTSRGTLLTNAGRVSMEDNGTQILLLDGTAGYIFDMSTSTFSQIVDPNFPNGATTATCQDGFFLVNLDTDVYISDYKDGLTWPGDFQAAESNPDGVVRVFSDHQDTYVLGDRSIEIWANTGAADFPFERIPGAALEWGLAAVDSIAKFDDSLMMLAQNRLGQVIAGRVQGYRIMRVSNHDLESKWSKYGNFADAVAYSYMLDGHPMYVVSFPTGGETWMYDGSTNGWSQLQSYGETRHRSDLHGVYQGRHIVTDFENGNVYNLKADTYTDNSDPITRTLVGRHVHDGYSKMGVDAFQLDIETGVGLATGQGSDPQAMLRVSRDGGRTWGAQRFKSFGKVGEYTKRCIWGSCGRARDFVFEVSISDPVKVAILGAGITPRRGAN